MDKCRKCGTEIHWLKHNSTNKNTPVDAEPNKDSNLVINRDAEMYRMATMDEKIEANRDGKNLYINHFVTCPNAKDFRRK